MQFGFDNRDVIKLLIKRGYALRQANFDKVEEIEQQINKHKTENQEKMLRPTTVILLFEHQKSRNTKKHIKTRLYSYFHLK